MFLASMSAAESTTTSNPSSNQDAPIEEEKQAQPVSMAQMLEQLQEARHKDTKISALEAELETLKANLIAKYSKANDEELESHIRPWLEAVVGKGHEGKVEDILQGMRNAQEAHVRQNLMSGDPGNMMDNPSRNQVIEVMCSAAAAHGEKVKELEAARAQIENLRGAVEERQKIDAIITTGKSDSSLLGKRLERDNVMAADVSQTDAPISECWSQLFTTVGRR